MSFSICNVGDHVDVGANVVEARLPFFDSVGSAKNRSKHRQMAHAVQPAALPHPGRKRDSAASRAGKLAQEQLRIASPMRRTD
jgi:hypothetical protein